MTIMGNERTGLVGWLLAFAVAVVAFAIGFVWLPSLQGSAGTASWLDVICRATGIARAGVAAPVGSSHAAVPTAVVWNQETRRSARSGDAQGARALALGCAGCHGPRGLSPSDAFPNLAGMAPEVLFKSFEDYRDGKRQNPTMQGIARALDEGQIANLAAFYASLPSPRRAAIDSPPVLVAFGEPVRSLAACAACHGPAGRKDGAPSLEGQKRRYLQAQLQAFASGTRENDMNRQMREIARALTTTELNSLAEWYARQRPE
jgi:cytochrome c553